MAERMAETSGILKNRKFLVSIYMIILILVAVVIATLIFIYNDTKDLYSGDYEEFKELQQDIELMKEDYSEQIQSINRLESTINSQEPTPELLEKVVIEHNEAILMNNQLIFMHERILELDVKEEDKKDSEKEIKLSNSAIKDHEHAIELLQVKISLLNFSNSLDSSLTCFQKINTDQTSSQIRSSVENCKLDLNSARSYIPVNEQDLPKTFEYLNEIENYWNITINLNLKIEEKKEEEANQLSDQLKRSSESRNTLEQQSKEELSQFSLKLQDQ